MLNQEIYNNCLKVLEQRMPLWVNLSDMLKGFDEKNGLSEIQEDSFVRTNRFIFNLSMRDFKTFMLKFSDKKRDEINLNPSDSLKESLIVAILLLTEDIKLYDEFLNPAVLVMDTYLENLHNYKFILGQLRANNITDKEVFEYAINIFIQAQTEK